MTEPEKVDNDGQLILLVSVSGGGKNILMSHLKDTLPELHYAVSCTSRPKRPGEKDGENYYFISEQEFEKRIEAGEFLEWVQIDGGRYYGTLKSEILEPINKGQTVIREVEVEGARLIKKIIPEGQLSIIFITTGSWEDMVERIKGRAPISKEELEHRRLRYEKESKFASEADYLLNNENGRLQQAKQDIVKLVENIINKNN